MHLRDTLTKKPYLYRQENSLAREATLTPRLIFDLKSAAAESDYELRIFTPDVDRDGYDVVLDDGDNTRMIQLKSRAIDASTLNWGIHKRLLRPVKYWCEPLGHAPSPETVGLGGAVVLVEISCSSGQSPQVTYRFTDFPLIATFEAKLIQKGKGKLSSDKLQDFWRNLFSGPRTEKITVPMSYFIRAKGPGELLALLCLHNRFNEFWSEYFREYLVRQSSSSDHTPASAYVTSLRDALRLYSDDVK